MNRLIFILAAAWLCAVPLQAAGLSRDRGLNVRVMPKQTVDAHPGQGLEAGFIVGAPSDWRPLLKQPVVQSAKEILAIFRRQPKTVQENGIWVVVPDDPFYSAQDRRR